MIDWLEWCFETAEDIQRYLGLHRVASDTRDLGAMWLSGLRWIWDDD